jgi:predicted membrane-bound mannosyltransferase
MVRFQVSVGAGVAGVAGVADIRQRGAAPRKLCFIKLYCNVACYLLHFPGGPATPRAILPFSTHPGSHKERQ